MAFSRVIKRKVLDKLFKSFTADDTIKTSSQYVDDATRDAFGSLRVAEGKTLFDTQFQCCTFDGTEWDKRIEGTGSIEHLPNESSVLLEVGDDDGDVVTWQSRRYIRYQPAKSQKVLLSLVFGASKTNLVKRCGYFDDENGVFLEQTHNTTNLVIRSKTTGEVVENRVSQANWNVDKFNGLGDSGVNLNITKAQIFFIDLEWLSVGRVRVGFVVDGKIYYAHYFNHANKLDSGYMTTANLPIRYEILNVGDTVSASNMKAICCSVQSESGFLEERYFPFSANNGTTPIAVTTRRPVLSIRPKAIFRDRVNRTDINPLEVLGSASSNDALIEVVVSGNVTGGTWVSAGDDSSVEYNVGGTDITGGRVVESFYAVAGSGQIRGITSDAIDTRIPLTLDIDGNNPIVLSVVATSISGTSNLLTSLNWREIY